jgi:hypothetical protein
MAQTYGIEAQPAARDEPQLPPARYLVLIDSAAYGGRLARLYLASRQLVAEFDAGAVEVQLMLRDLAPSSSAAHPDWDEALGQHSADERAGAQIYTLEQ